MIATKLALGLLLCMNGYTTKKYLFDNFRFTAVGQNIFRGAEDKTGLPRYGPPLGHQWLVDLMVIGESGNSGGATIVKAWVLKDSGQFPTGGFDQFSIPILDRASEDVNTWLFAVVGGSGGALNDTTGPAFNFSLAPRRIHLVYPEIIQVNWFGSINGNLAFTWMRYMETRIGEQFCYPE